MPIYEYICDDCSHELEALQGINDEVLSECPSCQQPKLRRKISAAAFRLKGSGWYETDFKKANQRNLAGDNATGNKASTGNEGSKKGADKPAKTETKKDSASKPKASTKTDKSA
ncbi:MAG: zinc ribbon domain-containing protein [Spiribacter sp.]|jgi:putative FmdB family regulatory protein|nr:zinc ribbon domain-containing protein [Spiribacter sp.]MDR9481041.1 zinc ribbon domain-containing protein [Spiribacter sp.]